VIRAARGRGDPMPLRAMPYCGREVVVAYLGSRVRGVVTEVAEGGRRVAVRTEDGERLSFQLNPATAVFRADGTRHGPRLLFDGEPERE
jgi:hypothetical protein